MDVAERPGRKCFAFTARLCNLDGNFVGRGDNIYTNGKGVVNFSPLAKWSHEMVLAYIAYHELPLPPIYGWINGYKRGTHAWPMRPGCKTKEEGWQEIHSIDPTLVEAAVRADIKSAIEFMKGRTLNGEDNQS